MKLINADVIHTILELYEIRKSSPAKLNDWEYGYNCGIERAESVIEEAPAVDAENVIRCPDCKWCRIFYHGHDRGFSYECAMLYLTRIEADDFCSKAKRKEHEDL